MTAIIRVLPIFLVEYQEVKLIYELNQFFNFDNNIFLLDASVDSYRFINGQEVIPQSVYVFKDVDGNITGLESLTNIQSKNTFMVVVAEGANFDSNLNLLKRIKEIHRLQTKIKIGMFLPNFVSSEHVKTLFGWCKEQLIVNIFAATYTFPNVSQGVTSNSLLTIFTFHPFGPLKVTRVTDVESYHSYFLSLNSNFQKHQLRVRGPFTSSSEKKLWLTVFSLMNASFVLVPLVVPYDENFWSKLVEKRIDIVPVLHRVISFTDNNATYMYPLKISTQVIIVPEALPYSEFLTYLRTLTSDEFFAYSLITIAAVIVLLSIIRYNKQKNILFFQSVTDVLNLLMNDNMHIKYQRLSCVEVFIIVPLTFVGLVIMNGILSNLKSYLTRPILQPQISSIEEIYQAAFPIHSTESWKHSVINILKNVTKHEDWIDKVFGLGNKQHIEQMETYNTSNSFLSTSENMKRLIEVQKHLNMKGFHNPQIELFNYHVADIVSEKFLFFERLDEIVHRIQSAGLYDLWLRIQDSNVKKRILKRNIQRLSNQNEIVKSFEFPIFIVYGWVAGAIVFVIEIIWKNFKLSQMKFCRILAGNSDIKIDLWHRSAS